MAGRCRTEGSGRDHRGCRVSTGARSGSGNRTGASSARGAVAGSSGSPAVGVERGIAIDARMYADIGDDLLPSEEDVFDHLPDEDADWLYDDAPEEAHAGDDDPFLSDETDDGFEGSSDDGW